MGVGAGARLWKVPSSREEDAAKLQLGPEFVPSKAQPLLITEAAFLLRVKIQSQEGTEYANSNRNPVLAKSFEYATRFDRLRTEDNTAAARELLKQLDVELHPFEVAQLASLMPESAEEAKTIIPSLKDKIDDDVLNDALQNLDSFTRGAA